MNATEFINRIRTAIPDAKDLMRANKIVSDYPNELSSYHQHMRSEKANLQLNKITHVDKMFRRARAFLDKGIAIQFGRCKIFSEMTTQQIKDFVNGEIDAVKLAKTFNETEDFDTLDIVF